MPTINFNNPYESFYNKYNNKRVKSILDDNISNVIDETVNAASYYEYCTPLQSETHEFDQEKDIYNDEKYEIWSDYARNLIKRTYKDEKEKNIGTWKESVKGFNIDVRPFQCPGCGISFQSKDVFLPGYIDTHEFDKFKSQNIEDPKLKLLPLCMRCKGFKGGNVLNDGKHLSNEYKETNKRNDLAIGNTAIDASNETAFVLHNTLKKNYHRHVSIVYIMDALDLYLDKRVVDFVVNRRREISKRVKMSDGDQTLSKLTLFYIVVNKIDLVPYDSRKRILCYVHKLFNDVHKELGLKPRHIFLTNSLTGNGVNLFYSVVLHSAEILRSKVYFIGYANSGKSTLLNWLAKFASDTKSPVSPNRLATSIFPGTTLRPVKIDIGKKYELYDTPGILLTNSITSHLSVDNIPIAIPKKHKAPMIHRVKDGKLYNYLGESLLLGPFVRIDLEDSKPYFFTPFISGNIPVRVASRKRLYISKEAQDLSRMYPVYEYDQSGNKIVHKNSKVPPEMEDEEKMLVPKKFKIIGRGWKTATVDICIRGLGFVAVAGALKATIKVYTHPDVEITLRESMFPSIALPF